MKSSGLPVVALDHLAVGDDLNNTGMTSRLRKVEVIRPPMTTMAIGARKLGSLPMPMAIGNMPAPIATVVITIGRARLRQASSSASSRVMPRSRRAMIAYSTSRIEFLVATPMSMIRPIIAGIDSAVRVTNSARMAPGTESTSAARMVTGCTKSLNSSTSTM
jgi:hypothetical protein